jgi:hypothetical protein
MLLPATEQRIVTNLQPCFKNKIETLQFIVHIPCVTDICAEYYKLVLSNMELLLLGATFLVIYNTNRYTVHISKHFQ